MTQKDIPTSDQHVWRHHNLIGGGPGWERMIADGVEWCSKCGTLKFTTEEASQKVNCIGLGFLQPRSWDGPLFYGVEGWPFGPPCTRVTDEEREKLVRELRDAQSAASTHLYALGTIAHLFGIDDREPGWADAVIDAARKHPSADLLQVMVSLVAHRGAFHNEDETPTREQWAYGVCEDAKALIAAARSKT